ncbi:MAG TPA: hypothetical protein ENK30_04695 [Anaerolineae bacterium]|nr:hypothetical protein [Anaerolineae bacterium]
MTTKSDFTAEEWRTLLAGPLATNVYIVVADLSVFGSIKEIMALSKDLAETQAKPDIPELLRFMVADLMDKDTVKGLMPEIKGDPETVKAQLKEIIKAAVAILDEKADPDEAAYIRQWMYDLAERTASAAREGGFLGIGSVRVSDQEKQALAELAELLGVGAKAEGASEEAAEAGEEASAE